MSVHYVNVNTISKLLAEGFEGADKKIEDIVRDAAQSMTSLGAMVTDVSVPYHKDGNTITITSKH